MTGLERVPGKLVLGIYLIFAGIVSIINLDILMPFVYIAGAIAGMLLIQEAAPAPGAAATPEALKNIGKVRPDDLTRIAGITPEVSNALNAANIKTYVTLGKTKPETLKKILVKVGGDLANIDPSGWPRQARLADKGRWDEMEPVDENGQETKA
jgi:hypothetical protein